MDQSNLNPADQPVALNGRLAVALMLYLVSLVASNTLGLKLMPFFGGLHLSVAVFSFPVVFLMTDVVGEVYGKPTARFFVWMGFWSIAVFMVYNLISLAVPWSPDGAWVKEAYTQVYGLSLRIALASLVAYLAAEYQDVFSFFLMRRKWNAKWFWLRSQLSNVWSQLVDSALFMVVAFAGVYPTPTLVNIIISWWLFKVAMGAVYSPLSYVGIRMLRGRA